MAENKDKRRIEPERQRFKSLVAQNPNYFGNLAGSSFEAKKKIVGNTKYEDVELKRINEALWEIEDDIRDKERLREFDQRFIELARAVYVTNDKRAAAKKELNLHLGSEIVEEKSYQDYS